MKGENESSNPLLEEENPPQYEQIPAPVQQQPQMLITQVFTKHSQVVTCFNCHTVINTDTKHEIGTGTFLASGIMCLVGLGLCSWIPCVVDSCKDTYHTCPECHHVLGMNKLIGNPNSQ